MKLAEAEQQPREEFACGTLNLEPADIAATGEENDGPRPVDPDLLPGRTFLQNIPDADSPIRFVCVNFHVFQQADGSRNLTRNDMPVIRQVFSWLNAIYTNYKAPDFTATCTSQPAVAQGIDTRIRFLLNRVEFYQDDYLIEQSHRAQGLEAAALARNPDTLLQLNYYYTNPTGNNRPPFSGHASYPPSANLAEDGWVVSRAKEHGPYIEFFTAKHFAHELGHVLGLAHTYVGEGADPNCDASDPFYLYDLHGCPPDQHCPMPKGFTNNVMASGLMDTFTTLQVALMHYSLDNLNIGRYVADCCAPKCVAVGATIHRHRSSGPDQRLEYERTLANDGWAWDGRTFTVPVDGTYHIDISFQKDSLIGGSTPNDVWIKVEDGSQIIGTAWSERAGTRRTSSRFPFNRVPQAQVGRRDSVSMATNVRLAKGTQIHTTVGSHNGEERHLVDVSLGIHLLCADCC